MVGLRLDLQHLLKCLSKNRAFLINLILCKIIDRLPFYSVDYLIAPPPLDVVLYVSSKTVVLNFDNLYRTPSSPLVFGRRVTACNGDIRIPEPERFSHNTVPMRDVFL